MDWQRAQEWERDWWGSCANTYGEETKQLLYADRMGLEFHHDGKSPYNIDLGGRSVLDIGGGPTSLLLKCTNFVKAVVLDPLSMPQWVRLRYIEAGVTWVEADGEGTQRTIGEEEYRGHRFDECWIYNTLQHVRDPATVITGARQVSGLIRLFEWVDTPTNEGHPHTLTEQQLNEWLHGEGKVEILNGQYTCQGKCYYGIFPTR